jgi:hypothetical protein
MRRWGDQSLWVRVATILGMPVAILRLAVSTLLARQDRKSSPMRAVRGGPAIRLDESELLG